MAMNQSRSYAHDYENIAHYRVLEKVAEGAMGAVFKAVDPNLEMPVAIKVLSPKIASDPETMVRFEREAKAAAKLRHPNIGHVFFIGKTYDNLPFYAMEFIEGVSLDDVIHRRMWVTGEQVMHIMTQVAEALQLAAEKGILHRDVKPGNIMITNEGNAKLVDFGLAKTMESTDASLTRSGVAMGTPNYLSPEQAKGEAADFRADMYSLGITFFEVLTGHLPYKSDTPMGVLMKHVQDPIPQITDFNQQFPKRVAKLILRMMSKSPRDRFPDYHAILSEIKDIEAVERSFIASTWGFCENDQTYVMVSSTKECTICGMELSEQVSNVYYSILLTGFQDDEAREKVTKYLVQSTKKNADEIRQILSTLPFVMAPKVTASKAKAFQQKFLKMGAFLELRKIQAKRSSLGHHQRRRAGLDAQQGRLNPSANGPSTNSESQYTNEEGFFKRNSLKLIVILSALLMIGLNIFIWLNFSSINNWLKDDIQPPPAKVEGATPPTPVPIPDKQKAEGANP